MSPPTLHDLRALLREALSSPDVAAGVASAVREATPKDAAMALVQEVLDTDPRPGVRRAAAEGVAATIAHWDESRQRAFFAEAIAAVPQNEDALMAMGVQMLRLVAKSLGTPALTEEVARATIALETESRYPNSVLAPRLGRAWYDASHTPVAALAELRRLAADTAALEREPGLGGGLLLLLGVLEIAFGSVTDGLAAFERVPIASVLPV
ncbi:MAG: hypothetical protein ACXWUG_31115, partial [Polyangiales bacterium]